MTTGIISELRRLLYITKFTVDTSTLHIIQYKKGQAPTEVAADIPKAKKNKVDN